MQYIDYTCIFSPSNTNCMWRTLQYKLHMEFQWNGYYCLYSEISVEFDFNNVPVQFIPYNYGITTDFWTDYNRITTVLLSISHF